MEDQASIKSTCLGDKCGQRLFFCASAIGLLAHLSSAYLFCSSFFFCLCSCLHLHLWEGYIYGRRVYGTGYAQFRLRCFQHSRTSIGFVVHAILNDTVLVIFHFKH